MTSRERLTTHLKLKITKVFIIHQEMNRVMRFIQTGSPVHQSIRIIRQAAQNVAHRIQITENRVQVHILTITARTVRTEMPDLIKAVTLQNRQKKLRFMMLDFL